VGRFWKFDSYYPQDYELGEQPKELSDWMDEWGIRSYVQSDRLPDPERRRPVTELTARRGRLVYALSPATDGGVPREALLPAEMLFPLTELWGTRQPGPLIRCWRIEAPAR